MEYEISGTELSVLVGPPIAHALADPPLTSSLLEK